MRNIELFETMFVQQQSSDEAHRKWYSQPEWYCANAYRSTQKIGSDILICKDPFGDKPVNEISKVLIAQGITDVILGMASKSILLDLWNLQELGWRLEQMLSIPISPFEATHNLSSPAISLTYAPDKATSASPLLRKADDEQVICITSVDLVSSAILERLRMGKRSWISMPTLEKYAQEVKRWWEKKGYSDIRPQISDSDMDDMLAHYPEYFERLEVRGDSGEDKIYIARKDGVSEQELRNRFFAALPMVYLTALSESWQALQKG